MKRSCAPSEGTGSRHGKGEGEGSKGSAAFMPAAVAGRAQKAKRRGGEREPLKSPETIYPRVRLHLVLSHRRTPPTRHVHKQKTPVLHRQGREAQPENCCNSAGSEGSREAERVGRQGVVVLCEKRHCGGKRRERYPVLPQSC